MSSNDVIAAILYEISEILTVKNDRFRSRAYQLAAQRITGLTEDLKIVRGRGGLEEIPGVGKSIASTIIEILDTGQSKVLEELKESLPKGVQDLMEIEGVGPRIAMKLVGELGIINIDQLEQVAKDGKIRELKGFGEKKEANILQSINDYRSRQTRFLLGSVLPIVDEMIQWMKAVNSVKKVEVAGSFRRRKETVGDLDLLVASYKSDKASERFITMPPIERVISHGPTRSTVYIKGRLQVDCRVIKPEEYGAALQYFTGSKEHNVKLRTIAVKQGYKLNEYGLFKRENDELVASESEEAIYKFLGMQWIPPELRENRGEIEAALEGKLPKLIEYDEVRGDLHVHTKWSDGTASITEMVEAARRLGLKYIAICDHSKSLGIAHGLNEERLLEQGKEIDKINENLTDFKVLKGIECDIKSDGSLDFSSSILKELDFVVASIHSGFKSETEAMTERLITAIHHEYVSTIGHPTGKIIQRRNPYSLNLDQVLEAAAGQNVGMEINAFPDRLDLDDVSAHKAKEYGVKLSIGSDAHAATQIDFLKLGVSVARRGWLETKDILNTKFR